MYTFCMSAPVMSLVFFCELSNHFSFALFKSSRNLVHRVKEPALFHETFIISLYFYKRLISKVKPSSFEAFKY